MPLQLKAQVQNFYTKPEGVNQQTNEVIPAQHRVQLLDNDENGKLEIVELRVHNSTDWAGTEGKTVVVPVKTYNVEGNSGLYMPKGVKPEILK